MLLTRRTLLKLLGIAGIATALPNIVLDPEPSPEFKMAITGEKEPFAYGYASGDTIGSFIEYPAYTLENYPVTYQLVKVVKPYRKYPMKKGMPLFWKDRERFIATPEFSNDLSQLAGVCLGDFAISRDRYWIQVANLTPSNHILEHRAELELAKKSLLKRAGVYVPSPSNS